MPLVFHHDDSFDILSESSAPNANVGERKILNVDDEVSYYNAYMHKDAACVRISFDIDFIDDSVFEGFTQLRQVLLPDSVRSIGDNAFSYCYSLTDIFLPDSIEWIGSAAFAGCTSLVTVCLPRGITEIDCDTFRGCTSLKEIFLPPSVQRIGDGAFAGCKNLEAVHGGEGLIAIESEAFFGCKKLKRLSLNSSVCSVADDAFANSPFCLPATYFGPKSERAFYERFVVVPHGVQTIGACAFSSSDPPKYITLPDSVRNISRGAFDRNFSNLASYHDPVTEDTIKRLPLGMNMPAGYLRQQTPFDGMMALALCNTVWKDCVTDADYEAMALYCDDPDARYLVMKRLGDFPSTHLERMMGLPRENVCHLKHLAEYICMYFPYLVTYDDDIMDIARELYQEAFDLGAGDAMRLLVRYCLYPEMYCNDDGMTGLYEYTVSPFEAEIILGYDHMYRGVYLGENELHFDSNGHRVPISYIHVIFAEYMKPDVLRMLMPYRADEIEDNDRRRLAGLIQQIREDEWIRFLEANEETRFTVSSDDLSDEADRWRMLNELDDDYPFEREEDLMFRDNDPDDSRAELFDEGTDEDDPFADFCEFADFDDDTEAALDQLDDDDEWIEEKYDGESFDEDDEWDDPDDPALWDDSDSWD